MILLHDNARPYVAKIVKDTLSSMGNYHTPCIHQTMLLITYFDRWHDLADETSKHMKK